MITITTIMLLISLFVSVNMKMRVKDEEKRAVSTNEKLYSGIELSLNTEYFKIIENLDINQYVDGLKLVDKEISIGEGGFFGYKITISKAEISNIKMPEKVDVANIPYQGESGNSKTRLKLTNLSVDILASYAFEVSFMKDSEKDSHIKLNIDEINLEFGFPSGKIDILDMEVNLGHIDIHFQNFFYKMFYKLYDVFHGVIENLVAKKINSMKDQVADIINDLIIKEAILKVPVVDLYFNATSTMNPIIVVPENQHKRTEKIVFQKFSSHDQSVNLSFLDDIAEKNKEAFAFVGEIMQGFLQEPNEKESYENVVNGKPGFIEFGVAGYAYIDPSHVPEFPPAKEMHFRADSYDKGFTLCLSDYTVNSLLYIVQQTGKLNIKLDSKTKIEGLPFTIDTEGLQSLVPELAKMYPEKKDAILKIGVPALLNYQPGIGTSIENIHFTARFVFDLLVQESDDPFDDAVEVLKVENDLSINLATKINKDDTITIMIIDAKVNDNSVVNTKFESFDKERFKESINNLLYVALDAMIKQKLENIDIKSIVEKYTPLSINTVTHDLMEGFNSLSFNIERKK